jgi:hypothetical protein
LLLAIAFLVVLAACPATERRTVLAPQPTARLEVTLPTAEQLVRNYHGKVQRKNGTKQKLYLQITATSVSAEGTRFKYTLNAPDRREDDTGPYRSGVVDATGRVTFGGLTGRARAKGAEVILQSVGIDGPPYWYLVGHPPETTKP